jgi:tRNA nucleotidyltransferase/poly(A) polymerase
MNKIDIDIKSNLSPIEAKIFNIIDAVRKKRAPSTVVRVAGGWTRDKLLGQPSDDIDFMVDNMSGAQFANLVAEELKLDKSPHVIQENPEKTKNIEAAKMHIPIDGQEVELDFVQARTEEYGTNRREVTTRPASAEEDAMRRDLTIGAIFYNVNEKKVEDFTGKGIKDLITNTIRTPYDTGDIKSVDEVKKTFIEDPLRVFRAIRFAAKYNATIAPATLAAIQDPDVINAIFFSERKIATERIGQEFQKMLKSKNPALALKLLKETGLMQHIVNESLKGTDYEGGMEELDMEQNNPHHEMSVWGHTYQVINNLLEYFPENNDEKKVIMILAALTHDLGKLYKQIQAPSESHPGTTSYHGHEKESQVIAEHILRFLKFENNIIKQVAGLARHHMKPHNFERGEGGDSSIRKFIRNMGEESLNWIDVLNLSVADAYSKGINVDKETIQSYQALRNKMEQALTTMQMKEDKVKPILNGNQIMQTLSIKPGPHMSLVQDYLKNLLDEYPALTEEEAITRLLEIKSRAEVIMNQRNDIKKMEDAVRYVLTDALKTANSSSKKINACVCPQQLFKKKYEDIQRLMSEEKYTEAIATIKELHTGYLEDDKIAKLVAISMFNILSKDAKFRDNDLLQFALDRTENSLFDPILNSYSAGLLILLKTATDENAILEIGENMAKMNPGILRSVIDALPQKVYHESIRTKLKAKLSGA